MSALDFGGASASNSFSRRVQFALPATPNGDCWFVWWQQLNSQPGAGVYPTLLQSDDGVQATTGGLLAQCDGDNGGAFFAQIQTTGGTAVYPGTGPLTYDGRHVLHVIQRNGSNWECQAVTKGGAYGTPGTGAVDGTVIGADGWSFGWDTRNPMGEFAYGTGALTSTQIEAIAKGVPVTDVATPVVYLRMRNGAAGTEANVGSGGSSYDGTFDGTGFVERQPSFAPRETVTSYSGVGLVVGSSLSHVGAAAVGATDSTVTTYPITLDATCTTSATRTVSAQLARGATSSLTAAVARHIDAIRGATQALSADKTLQASLLRDATTSLTATAVASRVVLLALDAVSTLSATVTRTAALVQSATTTATASIARSVSAIRSATTTLTAAAAAAIARTLGATTTATATATPQLTARRTFNAAQTLTATIYNRAVTRLFTVTQTIVPTLAKHVAATRSATTTLTATVGRTSAQSFGATTTMSATVSRLAARTLDATQAQSATVGRAVAVTRSATQTLTATALASRKFFVSVAAAVSMTADLVLETIFGGHPFTPTRGARVQGGATAARVTSPTVTAGIPEAGAARVSGGASKARVR